MAYKKLETAPTRERLIDDPKYMNLSRVFEQWFGRLVAHTNAGNAHTDNIQEYADNAAAIAGGLSIGDHYRTGDFQKIVH